MMLITKRRPPVGDRAQVSGLGLLLEGSTAAQQAYQINVLRWRGKQLAVFHAWMCILLIQAEAWLCCLQMPATAVRDRATTSISLYNRSEQAQAFEFAVPAGSDLQLSPQVGLLPPQGGLSILVLFTPQPDPSSGAAVTQQVSNAGTASLS